MANEVLLAPTNDRETSTTVTCDGIARIQIGLFVSANMPIRERVGARVLVENPEGTIPYRYPDKRMNVVVLTANEPVIYITEAGTYSVDKPLTDQRVGVFADTGA